MSDMRSDQAGVARYRYRIRGNVQGVFFRAWTQELGKRLSLRGAVRNRTDGSVEAHAEGSEEALEEFEKGLWEGSPASTVESVEKEATSAPLPTEGFHILPTA